MVDIIGFEGLYQINESGDVYSFAYNRLIKRRTNADGYSCVYLYKNGKTKTIKVHRLVAIHFVPNPKPDDYKIVNHKDGIKSNCAASNLEWCTHKHNIRHAWRTGLSKALKGDQNGNSKLSDEQRNQLVQMYALTELTQHEIARRFGVTQSNVSMIVRAFLRNHLIDAGLAIDAKTLKS